MNPFKINHSTAVEGLPVNPGLPFHDDLFPPLIYARGTGGPEVYVCAVIFGPYNAEVGPAFESQEISAEMSIKVPTSFGVPVEEYTAWCIQGTFSNPHGLTEIDFTVYCEDEDASADGRKTSRGTKVTVKTSQPSNTIDS